MPRSKIIFAIVIIAAVTPAAAQETPAADCSEALSTVEMNNCAGAELGKADAELNRVYAKALAAVPGLATDETPFDAKSWEAALRASQRAWLAFRDAECEEHVAKFWGGGTGATVDILGCKTEKTEQRTKELKQRYEIE
ncbi:MAG: DUF1311 domain-containing protein [Hyphomicrobium sp.]|jgi:uncharacterized protein YecT (DUF1311 family)|nr:DUF1311 domain-containing protein [Hyphomicrobium sp.]